MHVVIVMIVIVPAPASWFIITGMHGNPYRVIVECTPIFSVARRRRVVARGRNVTASSLRKHTIVCVCVALLLAQKSRIVCHGKFSNAVPYSE